MPRLACLVLLPMWAACGDPEGELIEDEPEQDSDGDGFTASQGDCDPNDDTIHPDAPEVCNGVDDNCNDEVDEGLAEDWFPDADDDGFGSDADAIAACARPDGTVPNRGDCDDSDPLTYPGANEYCDGIDNDCDGQADPTECRPLESADVRLDGLGDGHKVGHLVAGLGDLDADGAGDFVLGAPNAQAGDTPSGAAWFFDGPLSPEATLADAQAVFIGGTLGDFAGWSVAGAGDLNADGVGDVLVGAWGESSAGAEAGAVYLLHGPLSGTLGPADAAARLRGQQVGDSAGIAVAAAGIRGGTPGTLVGAPNADDAGFSSGAAYWVSGPVTGTVGLGDATLRVSGTAEGDQLGIAVAGIGDLDGDGADDLAISAPGSGIGAPSAGAVFVFTDPPTGDFDAPDVADFVLTGGASRDQAGTALSAFGDFNGDGYADFLVGAPDQSEGGDGAGAAYVVAGPLSRDGSLRDAHARVIGRLPADHAGNAVDDAGDFDGDGARDLLIGAYIEDSGGLNAGAAFLVRGPVTGVRYLSDADAGFIGEAESDLAGWSVASAGDVDGDALDDVLVGAPQHDLGGENAGVVYLLYAAGF